MFNSINNSVKRLILRYLEPSDIRTLLSIDNSLDSITEDPTFWESYLISRKRKIPQRLPKVSTYYLEYYEHIHEAKEWVDYMQIGHADDQPCCVDINDLNPSIFSSFPEIEIEIIKLQNMKYVGDVWSKMYMVWNRMKKNYIVEFVMKKNYIVEFVYNHTGYTYDKNIIVSEREMITIISILLSNEIYFENYEDGDGGRWRPPPAGR